MSKQVEPQKVQVWIDPRTKEACKRCNGTGRMPPWPGSKGLVVCGVCREHEMAPSLSPEPAAPAPKAEDCAPAVEEAKVELCGNEDCDSNSICYQKKGHSGSCYQNVPAENHLPPLDDPSDSDVALRAARWTERIFAIIDEASDDGIDITGESEANAGIECEWELMQRERQLLVAISRERKLEGYNEELLAERLRNHTELGHAGKYVLEHIQRAENAEAKVKQLEEKVAELTVRLAKT